MQCNNYEFRVGDEVETVDGMVGKIVSICHCEKCAERGFFEPQWETTDGKYSDYITVYQANHGFPGYRRIGKYVWNCDVDKERLTKNIFTKENKKMKEIKLTIDGKEVQLTNEQLKALGITKEKNNPFERVNKGTFITMERSMALQKILWRQTMELIQDYIMLLTTLMISNSPSKLPSISYFIVNC